MYFHLIDGFGVKLTACEGRLMKEDLTSCMLYDACLRFAPHTVI